jgi:hypothetical protein
MLPIRRRYRPDGTVAFFAVYSYDAGSLHVLDRLLHLACKPWQDGTFGPRIGAPRSRYEYLDAYDEREGLYR